MALRWDLKPVFPNAPEDSDLATITRRTVISGAVATVALVIVASWGLPLWQYLIVAVGIVAAFDAGDMRVPFEDDETFEIVETENGPVHRPTEI